MKARVVGLLGASVALLACGGGAAPAYYPNNPTPGPTDPNAVAGTQPQDTMFKNGEQPPPAPGTTPPPEDPATFDNFVKSIKDTMPTVAKGSAVAVQFVNTQTGYRYSSGFLSEDGFVPFQGFPGESIMIANSDAGETFTVVMSKMRPGHFECSKDTFALEFATAGITGTDGQANWSDNTGGDCEIDIYPATIPGDFQGKISGKLVSNDGQTVFTLDKGFFYARRPFVAGQSAAPSGPVTRPQIPQGKPKFQH